MDYLFEAQGVEQILIKVATGNEASRAIAERLGFGWEDIQHDAGRVGGQMVDILTYRMDARQWAARKAQA
ncbi:MAG: N-acetyltransferase [Bacteroidetes bacterium]|nr:MAG: N-acetyltransferase [Bacteroidota bacterium]